MVNIEQIEDIYTMSLEALYNIFIQLIDDIGVGNVDKSIINVIKNGNDIELPIQYLINSWYQDYPEKRITRVKGIGSYNIIKFHDDLDNRERLLRQFILDNTLKDKITKARC